jgi:nucleotide-binding universal stress UspA family protein
MKQTPIVLHATDFSPASRRAFEVALARARESHGKLVLVHVVPEPVMMVGDGYVPDRTWRAVEEGQRREATRQLEKLAAQARRRRVPVATDVRRGVAWEEITRAADRLRADLIVLGTHGRSGLSRMFLGSVAERVVGTARQPVLTVHGGAARRRAA